MANKKHPRLLEAIENAKRASLINRGMYPYTVATNVFYQDGTRLEAIPGEEGTTDVATPDTVVDLTDPETSVSNVLAEAENGEVIELQGGTVEEELTLDKSVTLNGENAGVAQNFKQEV